MRTVTVLDSIIPLGKFSRPAGSNAEHYESQNRFSDYPRYVNARRQRHNLEGNADIRLDRTQQGGLDDLMEYQNLQLEERESLQEQFKKAKEELDAAKTEVYKAGDSKFRDTFREIRPNCSEDSNPSESSHRPNQWVSQEHKLGIAQIATKYAEREVELLKDLSKAAELDSSKEIPQSDQIKATLAMKQLKKSKKRENKI